MEGTIGEIRMFAGNFSPRNWAYCQGQLLSIATNQALFSILGTMYGGDGRTTFGLPDFRGRACVGPGTGPGLSNYIEGEKGGYPTTTLLVSNMPSHTHTSLGQLTASIAMAAYNGPGNTAEPSGAIPAIASQNMYAPTFDSTFNPVNSDATVVVNAINNGGSQSFDHQPPYLVMNYIICTAGIFPSRN